MLRQGSTGALVKTLQRLLNALGYGLDVDGDFGPETDRAVRGFQAKNGLDADGVVGPMTAGALNSGGSSSEESSESEGGGGGGGGADGAVLTGNPMLREGSDGTLVKELQKLLNEHGASLVVDGDFGPQTASAVRSFQSVNGLVADGVVGPLTASKLNSAGAKDIGSGGGVGGGKNEDDAPPESDPKSVSEWRDRVLSAAESHLGAPYYWGADGPNMFDCSGFVLYVLRQDTGLVNWGDDTAAGIQGRLPKTSRPEQGDLVFYAGSGGAAHVEMVVGGTSEIGCSGGGSSTFGNNPNAKVQYGDMTADSRSRSYGSIKGLIDAKIAGAKA
jgi:peptidoglycan hydrolase-like protein with peptidoglycan-binding domain